MVEGFLVDSWLRSGNDCAMYKDMSQTASKMTNGVCSPFLLNIRLSEVLLGTLVQLKFKK